MMLIEEYYTNLTDDDKERLLDLLTAERRPVDYVIEVVKEGSYDPTITIKAFGVTDDNAAAVALLARKVADTYYREDISE